MRSIELRYDDVSSYDHCIDLNLASVWHIIALILFLIYLVHNDVIMPIVKQVFTNSSCIICVFPTEAMKCLSQFALWRLPTTSNTFLLNCIANYLNKFEIDVKLQQTYRSILYRQTGDHLIAFAGRINEWRFTVERWAFYKFQLNTQRFYWEIPCCMCYSQCLI